MKTRLILTLFAVLASLMWARAADYSGGGGAYANPVQRWHWRERSPALPFPRSERAQRVRAADMCWTECGSFCTWGQNDCLRLDEQGRCLAWTDACDRSCLRQCRSGRAVSAAGLTAAH